MGFVIASVAGFDPVRVEAVALMSYAFTLWTYLQRDEWGRFESLRREKEAGRLADMMAAAYHAPKLLSRFDSEWERRAMGSSVTEETREEMSRRADDLWAQHEAALKTRPVS